MEQCNSTGTIDVMGKYADIQLYHHPESISDGRKTRAEYLRKSAPVTLGESKPDLFCCRFIFQIHGLVTITVESNC